MGRLRWALVQWDRIGAATAISAGMLALLLGWLGVRNTAYPAEQIPFVISGAVLGVVLVGLGATAWLSADLRDEWRKLDRLEEIMVLAAQDDDVDLQCVESLDSVTETSLAMRARSG